MTRTRRALWGIVTNYASTAVTAVAGLVLVPIVLRFVTREDYGLWAAVGQAIGYLTLLDLGVGSAIVRRTAELRDRNDARRAIKRTVSTAVAIYGALGLVFLAVGLTVAPLVPRVLAIGPEHARMARQLFVLMVVYGAMSLPLRVSFKALYGVQEMARANVITLVENLLTPVTAVVLLVAGVGLLALPLGSIFAGAAAAIIGLVVLCRSVPDSAPSWRAVSASEGRELFRWSWLLWLNSFAVLVIYQTDNIVVAAGAGLTAATVYALTSRLPLYAMPVIFALSDSCLPGAVELCAQGKIDRLRRVYLRATRFTIGAAVAVGIVAVCFNDWFVQLWVGAQNFGGTFLTLLFAVILVYRVMLQTSAIVVIGTGALHGVVFMSIVEAALNLALSLLWVRRFGIAGVAAGTVVAGLLTSAWFVTHVVRRELALGLREHAEAIARPIAAGVPAALTGMAVLGSGLTPGWPQLVFGAGAVGAVYAAGFLVIGLTGDERREAYARVGAGLRLRSSFGLCL